LPRKLGIFVVAVGLLAATAFWFLTTPTVIPASALGAHTPNLENGRVMFFAGGCASCHATPKQEDRTRLGGGLALATPFGTFHVPNISPDRADGIGGWSEAQFATAMLRGTSPSGVHYYPAFPYSSYQRMRIEDVRDLFAYIGTLPPMQGKVREHELPFPFTVRRGLGLWKMLHVDGNTFALDVSQSPEWNRGAYLAEAAAHCAECHSPRDFTGGIRGAQRYAGGPNPEGEGWVPNITQAALGDWTVEDIADLLATGQTPNGDKVGSSMLPVVRNTAELPEADRRAIAVYIKSLPAVEGPKPPGRSN
jgi:mono/diheme cytochrome c family protein